MRPASLFLFFFIFIFISLGRAADTFEIKDGDRVLFLGDVLLEREGTYGYLETRMHEQFPDRHFTVRNLSMSGDTPLGWSRASFDPPDKGFDRLKEQLALVKPTVVFLGYGMAASLQEMADRSGDITFNPDTVRYGAEPMSAGRFKKEMGQCMDAINATDAATKVRFVLLSPIRHEDLRKMKPGLPDPAEHNKLLEQYSKALEELAKERGAPFISLKNVAATVPGWPLPPFVSIDPTENGIHLTKLGYADLSFVIGHELGWSSPMGEDGKNYRRALRAAIVKKNELFFNRWRPENHTYLFGFRKHEQGQNAKEIPEFDPLIDTAEAQIDKLKRNPPKTADVAPAAKTEASAAATVAQKAGAPAAPDTLPLPQFDLDPALEMTLWAENPLLEKPTEMNWDSAGRLWVCSSGLYPQIAPGEPATDHILIIEDTDHDGKGDKSTVFADGLLIPTGVEADPSPDGKMGCYVGQSTELLHFRDTDGDGKADEKRVVLSGFGTEDTHHILHTLRWGPDGRLYFNQSIYIHSHLETPWGMVRMNSGAVMAYDPRTERVEVLFKGFCNPWGHAWDKWGQEFVTDGAGFQGVSWGILGAQYFTYENGRNILGSISPGNYPKFAGLELIQSSHFPADWQGNAITCDFRAHRIVRFQINDLSDTGNRKADTGKDAAAEPLSGIRNPQSGFITKEMPDVCRTSDVSFRPIDVKLGPDGALYVADWSNPVINHGEVDFRDPRRDHTHGRIWRIGYKGGSVGKPPGFSDEAKALSRFRAAPPVKDAEVLSRSKAPRERVEGMRALCKTPSPESAALVLDAALKAPEGDPYYAYAAALSINDLAGVWTDAIASGKWTADSPDKQKQLAWGLANIRPDLASATVAKLAAANKIPFDGSGPWIELLGQAGGPKELQRLYLGLLAATIPDGDNMPTMAPKEFAIPEATLPRVARALVEAARQRGVKPENPYRDDRLPYYKKSAETPEPPLALWQFFAYAPASCEVDVVRLLGLWKADAAAKAVAMTIDAARTPEMVAVSFESLRMLGSGNAVELVTKYTEAKTPAIRRRAVLTLAALRPAQALPLVVALFNEPMSDDEMLGLWRELVKDKAFTDLLTTKLPANLPKAVTTTGVRAAREAGKGGEKLLAALSPMPSVAAAPRDVKAEIKRFSTMAVTNGHPIDGEAIYHRIGCAQCHSISGAGGKFGPDFTSLGASAPLDYIVESLFDPASKVKEGYIAFAFTMKDGSQMNGIPTRETATEQFIRVGPGPEIPLVKANIAKRDSVGSMMPAGLIDALNDEEKLNLISFLSQVGKPGPFDATKSNVARIWWLFPSSVLASAVTPGGDAPAVIANVNGALPKQRLVDTLPLVANPGDGPKAATKFQLATAGKVKLNLTGIREAWLDGQGLAVASEPSPTVDLAAGVHTLAVRLDPKALPETLRVESAEVRFLTE